MPGPNIHYTGRQDVLAEREYLLSVGKADESVRVNVMDAALRIQAQYPSPWVDAYEDTRAAALRFPVSAEALWKDIPSELLTEAQVARTELLQERSRKPSKKRTGILLGACACLAVIGLWSAREAQAASGELEVELQELAEEKEAFGGAWNVIDSYLREVNHHQLDSFDAAFPTWAAVEQHGRSGSDEESASSSSQ